MRRVCARESDASVRCEAGFSRDRQRLYDMPGVVRRGSGCRRTDAGAAKLPPWCPGFEPWTFVRGLEQFVAAGGRCPSVRLEVGLVAGVALRPQPLDRRLQLGLVLRPARRKS